MNDTELSDHLDEVGLPSSKCKAILLEKENRKQIYQEAIKWHKANRARQFVHKFYVFRRKNSIFIEDELYNKFVEFDELIYKAKVEVELALQHPAKFVGREARDNLESSGPSMMASLERQVRDRLWT